jgi:DNA-binding transcriptional LysR family regulator
VSGIDPRRLETFRVVAQTGKISSAAKLLHLSQPAVTAQVRALEEECGRALLDRTSRGVTPTRWGLRLLDAAREVHRALDDALAALADETEELSGELVLAASMTTSAYVVTPLLAAFRELHPEVAFRLEVGNTERVTELLASGRVPLAMVEGPARSAQVHLERYLDDELVPVVATSSPRFRDVSSAADLLSLTLLLREPGSGSRVIVERALARALGAKQVLRSLLQLGSNQSVKMAAVAGLGVAFLSRWSVRLEVAAGALRILPIRDLRIVRAFSWATRSPPHGLVARFQAWAVRNPPPLP